MPTDYNILKKAGHSPAKAAEIILDVRRGDQVAIRWVELFREGRAQ